MNNHNHPALPPADEAGRKAFFELVEVCPACLAWDASAARAIHKLELMTGTKVGEGDE